MTKLVTYVAILDDSENLPGEYTVTFPDVPATITDGANLTEALYNAEQALGLVLFDEESLPAATPIFEVQADNPNKIVTYVVADLDKAAEESFVPLVKKILRFPPIWCVKLNELASIFLPL